MEAVNEGNFDDDDVAGRRCHTTTMTMDAGTKTGMLSSVAVDDDVKSLSAPDEVLGKVVAVAVIVDTGWS